MSEKKQSVGGGWNKTSKNGNEFISFSIEGKRYTAFKNTYKKGDKEPDWRVFVDDWKPESKANPQPQEKQVYDDSLPF